jgi:hypothetical protein
MIAVYRENHTKPKHTTCSVIDCKNRWYIYLPLVCKRLKGKKLRKELIFLLSVEGQPTKAVLAQTCMAVFLIRSVSDTILAMFFSSETAYGPQFDKHCCNPLIILSFELQSYKVEEK